MGKAPLKKFARVISKQKQMQNKKKINKKETKNNETKPKKPKTTLTLVSLISAPQFTVSLTADAIFATLSITINEFSIPN